LTSRGREGLNTNLIAETAGVSVGTLYGYFPNKQAILLDMARRELDALRDRVAAALLDETDAESDPLRRAIRALVKGYGRRGKARRILMETLFAHGGSEEMARPVYEIADLVIRHQARVLPHGASAPSEIGLFVITRAIDSVIRSATYEAAPFLESTAFEDELLRLVKGYLLQPGQSDVSDGQPRARATLAELSRSDQCVRKVWRRGDGNVRPKDPMGAG
jgi:AcrR family transcriptional regulator